MSSTSSDGLALLGGPPVRDPGKAWPAWPITGAFEREQVAAILESGAWWYGPWVRRFEEEYAAFHDAAHCVTCNSGTIAAEIILQALGIGPGDEVIVPPYTFFATASTVMRMGADPVFVDVDASWCLDPEGVEAAITPRTRAIMPVHFAGRVCDMDRLGAIARAHGLRLIEDACHSWGSKWKGKGTGALGDCGVFSFQHSKNITAGEGGAILTDDAALAATCRSLTNSGRVFEEGEVWFAHAGTNVRLTEIAAAMLCGQLERLEAQTEARARSAALLDEGLRAIPGLEPQPGDPRITRRAYHLYCLRFDAAAFGCSRARLIAAAEAEGLPLRPGYNVPLYRQPVFKDHPRIDYGAVHCPAAEDLCAASALWIAHPLLLGTPEDMADIVAIFRKIHEHAAALAA